jgi:uncharacterized damage-inducible protein DinB
MTTATINPVAAPIAMIFSVNDGIIFRALEGLTPEEVWRAPTDRNNAMLWVAGHVVQTRAIVLEQLGEALETGWGEIFNRGATLGDRALYPSREEIEQVMRDVSARLHARLALLDEEHLTRPATLELPDAKTFADQLAFFALHETYHVGQMAYIRKALGYPRLVG